MSPLIPTLLPALLPELGFLAPEPTLWAGDEQTIVYIVIAVIWALSSLFKKAKEAKQAKQAPPPEPLPPPPPPPPAYEPAPALEPAPPQVEVGESAFDSATVALYNRLDAAAENAVTARHDIRSIATRAEAHPSLAFLRAALVSTARDRALALADRAEEVRRFLAEEPAETARALGQLEQEAARLKQLVALCRDAVEQRTRSEHRGRLLWTADTVCGRLFEPMRRALAGDRAVAALRPFAAADDWTTAATLRFQEIGFLRAWLRPNHGNNFALWGLALHDLARSATVVSPRLRTELRQVLGVSGSGALPAASDLQRGLQVSDFVAPWFPSLFGDAVAAVALGPPYMEALATLSDDSDAGKPMVEPPMALRLAALRVVLSEAGHGEAAQAVWAEWQQRVGPPDELVLTLRDGMRVAAPYGPFAEVIQSSARALCRTALPSLGGASLLTVPGLLLPAREMEAVQQARRRIMGGEIPEGALPRLVFSAALAAYVQMPATGPKLAELVGRASSPVAPRRGTATAATPGELDLRPTPEVIVDAIVFGAIFEE